MTTGNAAALRVFLRTKGVTTTHPHEVSNDMSSLEILTSYELEKLQCMLDEWKLP